MDNQLQKEYRYFENLSDLPVKKAISKAVLEVEG